jgi:hypothetical protein
MNNETPDTTDKSLDATPLSQKAIAFRHETNRRKRDKLFLEICEHYKPKILKQMYNVKPCDKSEFTQIYMIEVYTALIKWKMTSNFNTYLFSYLKGVYRKFMGSIKLFKKDLDYKLFSDMTEYETNLTTYEDIESYYEENE